MFKKKHLMLFNSKKQKKWQLKKAYTYFKISFI